MRRELSLRASLCADDNFAILRWHIWNECISVLHMWLLVQSVCLSNDLMGCCCRQRVRTRAWGCRWRKRGCARHVCVCVCLSTRGRASLGVAAPSCAGRVCHARARISTACACTKAPIGGPSTGTIPRASSSVFMGPHKRAIRMYELVWPSIMSRVDVGVMGGPRVCTKSALIHDFSRWSHVCDPGREGVNSGPSPTRHSTPHTFVSSRRSRTYSDLRVSLVT